MPDVLAQATTKSLSAASATSDSTPVAASARQTPPSYPRTLWRAWNAYAQRAGGYQAELLLSCVYFFVLGPSAFVARLAGVRLIDLTSAERRSYWIERKPGNRTLADLEREF